MIEHRITDQGLFDFKLHRLAKETKLYGTETTALEVKKAKFIADGAEEWDIKNAVSVFIQDKFQLPASLCSHEM
jgi:hypothetical protein